MGANDLDAGIRRGLEFLRRSQLPSGEFKVYLSPGLNLQHDSVFDSSPFTHRYCLLTWLRRQRQRG